MKKRLNTEEIANELAGSVFFPSKTTPSSPSGADRESLTEEKAPVETVNEHKAPFSGLLSETEQEEMLYPRTPERGTPSTPRTSRTGSAPVPLKRIMKQRQPFDIYQDQYEALKSEAAKENMQGGVGSMSRMVREAIDEYLVKRRSE